MDDCLDTPQGELVNAHGCSCSQLEGYPAFDDGNQCTIDTCYAGTVVHTVIPNCGEEQQPKEQTTTTTTKTVKKIGSGPSKGNSDYHIICGDHFCVMPQEMEEGIYYCPLDCSSILW